MVGAPGQVVEQPGTLDAGQATVAPIHPARQPFQIAPIAVEGGAGQAVLGPDGIEEALDARAVVTAQLGQLLDQLAAFGRSGNKGHG
ncbi:hypothetical protein G6F59_017445 [Rhizopus arrhizus]|nr:hypothetical protein G6F59_017445 [Rhizopus arrhizus]